MTKTPLNHNGSEVFLRLWDCSSGRAGRILRSRRRKPSGQNSACRSKLGAFRYCLGAPHVAGQVPPAPAGRCPSG